MNVKEFKTRWLRGYVNPELRKLPVKSKEKPLQFGYLQINFALYAIDVDDMKSPYTSKYKYEKNSFVIKDKTNQIIYIYDFVQNKIYDKYGYGTSYNYLYLPEGDYWIKIIAVQSAEDFSNEWEKIIVKPNISNSYTFYGTRALLHSTVGLNYSPDIYKNTNIKINTSSQTITGVQTKFEFNNYVTSDIHTTVLNSKNEEIFSFNDNNWNNNYTGFLPLGVNYGIRQGSRYLMYDSAVEEWQHSPYSGNAYLTNEKVNAEQKIIGYGSVTGYGDNQTFTPSDDHKHCYTQTNYTEEKYYSNKDPVITNSIRYTEISFVSSFAIGKFLYYLRTKLNKNNKHLIDVPLSKDFFDHGGLCIMRLTDKTYGNVSYQEIDNYDSYKMWIDTDPQQSGQNVEVVKTDITFPEAVNYNYNDIVNKIIFTPYSYSDYLSPWDYSKDFILNAIGSFESEDDTTYGYFRSCDVDFEKMEATCYYISALIKYAYDYEEYLKYLDM